MAIFSREVLRIGFWMNPILKSIINPIQYPVRIAWPWEGGKEKGRKEGKKEKKEWKERRREGGKGEKEGRKEGREEGRREEAK